MRSTTRHLTMKEFASETTGARHLREFENFIIDNFSHLREGEHTEQTQYSEDALQEAWKQMPRED